MILASRINHEVLINLQTDLAKETDPARRVLLKRLIKKIKKEACQVNVQYIPKNWPTDRHSNEL